MCPSVHPILIFSGDFRYFKLFNIINPNYIHLKLKTLKPLKIHSPNTSGLVAGWAAQVCLRPCDFPPRMDGRTDERPHAAVCVCVCVCV